MSTTTTAAPPAVPEFDTGDRLAKALEHAHISVAEMAQRIGVSRQTIGNYLSGRTVPKLAVVRVWAHETNVDLAWLATGSTHSEQGLDVSIWNTDAYRVVRNYRQPYDVELRLAA